MKIAVGVALLRCLVLAGWAGASVALVPQHKVSPPARPNILVLLADDWSYPHAGFYGDSVVPTPFLDSLARRAVVFTRAFSTSPFCTPARAALLTGLYPHRLGAGANLRSTLPVRFPNYTTLLEQAGYHVGSTGKGWGPGSYTLGGYDRNPAGRNYASVEEFLDEKKEGQPFCFWMGSTFPHRPYPFESGQKAGLDRAAVRMPGWLPDLPVTRTDLLDYYKAVGTFDAQRRHTIDALRRRGLLENTLVVVAGDNGMPFTRGKTNLYDGGTRVPLFVWWPEANFPPRQTDAMVSFVDLMPTFLDAAGIPKPALQDGNSLLPLLGGAKAPAHQAVFLERERHLFTRPGHLGYPSRALRTEGFLYIRNLTPERYPLGDTLPLNGREAFAEADPGPTKAYLLEHRDEPLLRPFYDLTFAKRPGEELYDLKKDPDQLRNVVGQPAYRTQLRGLRARLEEWMKQTDDPQGRGERDYFGQFPYVLDMKKDSR